MCGLVCRSVLGVHVGSCASRRQGAGKDCGKVWVKSLTYHRCFCGTPCTLLFQRAVGNNHKKGKSFFFNSSNVTSSLITQSLDKVQDLNPSLAELLRAFLHMHSWKLPPYLKHTQNVLFILDIVYSKISLLSLYADIIFSVPRRGIGFLLIRFHLS